MPWNAAFEVAVVVAFDILGLNRSEDLEIARYKQFIGNSFYVAIGAGVATSIPREDHPEERPHSMATQDIAIGNQWIAGHHVLLGAEWVGVSLSAAPLRLLSFTVGGTF